MCFVVRWMVGLTICLQAIAVEFDVEKADYGIDAQRVDVTEAISEKNAYLPGSFLAVNAGNWLLPKEIKDPAPGKYKELRIFYRTEAGEATLTVGELQRGCILLPAVKPGKDLKIERAFWGCANQWSEVTLQVKTLLELEKTIEGDLRGVLKVPDPAPGKHKFLLVFFSRDFRLDFKKINDHAGKLNIDDLKEKIGGRMER